MTTRFRAIRLALRKAFLAIRLAAVAECIVARERRPETSGDTR